MRNLIHITNLRVWIALAALFFPSNGAAQTVTLHNDSTSFFGGWVQVNVDLLPPHSRGTHSDRFRYILGKQTGLDTHSLDIYCGLSPGESKVFDLSEAEPIDYDPLPGYALDKQMWGGVPISVAGVPLVFNGAQANGAAWDGHWRGRVGPLLHVDLFVHWYPDDQAWAPGELVICASNPAVPDVVALIPGGFAIEFGDARVLVPGLATDAPLMAAGDWLADGQCRILPFVLCWERHGGNLGMCRAIAEQQVQARGIVRLHAAGNPILPAGFDARAWAHEVLPETIETLHQWRNSRLDPQVDSAATGAQGSQSFVAGPAMADPAAIAPIYLAAIANKWPMHHLEANGDPLDWRLHPSLRMFYGRVNRRICDETLGKPVDPTRAETHGWAGPEDEHWFDWTLWAGARLKGTPASQWLLRAHANQLICRYVVEPPGNWLTANRGVGWYCFMVGELYRNLEDRDLAEALKARFLDVYLQLIWPMGADGSWWSWKDDPRIGPGVRAIPWQAAVLALGLDWAGEAIGDDRPRGFAYNIAQEILGRTYVKQENGRWTSSNVVTQDGSPLQPSDYGYYDWFGTPMVVACVLRHDPQHAQAREIWLQMLGDNPNYQQASWLCCRVEPTTTSDAHSQSRPCSITTHATTRLDRSGRNTNGSRSAKRTSPGSPLRSRCSARNAEPITWSVEARRDRREQNPRDH